MVAANAALAEHKASLPGKVKVTAFDYLDGAAPASGGGSEVLVFPGGVRFTGLSTAEMGGAVVSALAAGATPNPRPSVSASCSGGD